MLIATGGNVHVVPTVLPLTVRGPYAKVSITLPCVVVTVVTVTSAVALPLVSLWVVIEHVSGMSPTNVFEPLVTWNPVVGLVQGTLVPSGSVPVAESRRV